MEEERRIQVKKELDGVTFKPRIKDTGISRANRQEGLKTEDLLILQGRLVEDKKEKLRQELLLQEK